MKPADFTALDIGEEGITAAVFRPCRDGALELLDCASASYDSAPASMAREARVAVTLKALLQKRRFPAGSVVVALEGQAVFSRLVQLPPVPAERREQTIRHEAVQNIPFPIEEVEWDAHVMDPGSAEPEVLLVAVKSDFAAGMISAVAANGLPVEGVEVAPVALANAVRYCARDAGNSILLVDAGPRSTHLVFVEGERTFFRTLSVGAESADRLQQEICRSISFYCSRQGGRRPERVLLAGQELSEAAFSEAIELPVERFEPQRSIKNSAGCDTSGNPRLGVLIGLAVRGIEASAIRTDLLPAAFVRAGSRRRRRPWLMACCAVVILIGLVWAMLLRHASAAAAETARSLEGQIQDLERVEAQMVPLETRIEQLQQRAGLCRDILRKQQFWRGVLLELRAQLPAGMFLLESRPLLEEGRVVGLQIHVLSYLDKEPPEQDVVTLLRDRLRQSAMFSERTRVNRRPSKQQFARHFVLDLYFEGAVLQ